MSRADRILMQMLDELTSCVRAELDDDLPCFVGLYAGSQVSADFCSCTGRSRCGMAWVRLAGVFPSEKPPVAAINPTTATPLAAQIEVGAYRCRSVSAATGKAPDAAAQANDTLRLVGDIAALHRAIRCCRAVVSRPHALGRWAPSDGGDCGGGTWQVTVQLVPS